MPDERSSSTISPLSDEDIEALRQDRGTAYAIRNDRLLATLDAKDREWNAHEASCMKAVMDECDEVKRQRDALVAYGEEGWSWVEDILNALHPDATVFDFKERIDALVADRDRLLVAAGIAIEAFTQVEDDVRYDPVFWAAMTPLREARADITAKSIARTALNPQMKTEEQ
jgi:hypothetical protein